MEQADIITMKTACKSCHKQSHMEEDGMGYVELAKVANQ
jgi:cytochrome c553